MALAMVIACMGVGFVALLLARAGLERDDHVSDSWRSSFSRERRDD
jgi:hypothetical protein